LKQVMKLILMKYEHLLLLEMCIFL
jgi:hypothetical protein